jgi:hypothetical protein
MYVLAPHGQLSTPRTSVTSVWYTFLCRCIQVTRLSPIRRRVQRIMSFVHTCPEDTSPLVLTCDQVGSTRYYSLVTTRTYTSGGVCVPWKTRSKDEWLSDHFSRTNGHWFGSFGTGHLESLSIHSYHCVSFSVQQMASIWGMFYGYILF